ncbi:Serine hydroxymethyltransferase, partial [Clarias magur]
QSVTLGFVLQPYGRSWPSLELAGGQRSGLSRDLSAGRSFKGPWGQRGPKGVRRGAWG